MSDALLEEARKRFYDHFGRTPTSVAYAPGRVEVLGNHTDYNEGYVLSAAIDRGTFFLAAPTAGDECRLVAGDLMVEDSFSICDIHPGDIHPWANYVKGVSAGLKDLGRPTNGFLGLFYGDIPIGSGLSSSAALEVSTGMALADLYGISLDRLELARLAQMAEHRFAGVKCGLLDQITSLFGKAHHLVMSDFRTLDTEAVPLGDDGCFVVCDTAVKHALVDGEYNERRAKCEEARDAFGSMLDRPIRALRDVTWAEWKTYAGRLDPTAAKRAAHVIGENDRVLEGQQFLRDGDLGAFGRLMFASHQSSVEYFENSCPELDFLVKTARAIPGALGARLSGGGFGGSAVVLTHPRDAEVVAQALASAYARQWGHACRCRTIVPSDGARMIHM